VHVTPGTHAQKDSLQSDGVEIVEIEDTNWRADARGEGGEEASLTLQLRVVADAGFIGLPNAGKTSLLRCMTAARAAVASYPFTTLMPNLGVLRTGGHADSDADPPVELDFGQHRHARPAPVLVDLPGLIEGAHTGRGLGRMFLRHLARTKVAVHVLDAAAENPAADYWVVREELRMYNPEYCTRPFVVALNKMDLPDAAELQARPRSGSRSVALGARPQRA
jgi:GTPase